MRATARVLGSLGHYHGDRYVPTLVLQNARSGSAHGRLPQGPHGLFLCPPSTLSLLLPAPSLDLDADIAFPRTPVGWDLRDP